MRTKEKAQSKYSSITMRMRNLRVQVDQSNTHIPSKRSILRHNEFSRNIIRSSENHFERNTPSFFLFIIIVIIIIFFFFFYRTQLSTVVRKRTVVDLTYIR